MGAMFVLPSGSVVEIIMTGAPQYRMAGETDLCMVTSL